jgi:hypothetical protein
MCTSLERYTIESMGLTWKGLRSSRWISLIWSIFTDEEVWDVIKEIGKKIYYISPLVFYSRSQVMA